MKTPWGESQSIDKVGDGSSGILFVSTASHGGYYVPPGLHSMMPPVYQKTFAGGPWYEEDCDWAKVVLSFPHLFPEKLVANAHTGARAYFPEDYAEAQETALVVASGIAVEADKGDVYAAMRVVTCDDLEEL